MLPHLIRARVLARIIISRWRAIRFPGNSGYILRNTPAAWAHLNRLVDIPVDQIAERIRAACRAG